MSGHRLMAALVAAMAFLVLPLLVPGAAVGNASASFRLPRAVLPSHYDVYIETFLGDDAEGFKFQGHVVITLAAKDPEVTEIRLHAKDLEVQKSATQLSSEGGQAPAVSGVEAEPGADFLVVRLDSPLQPCLDYQLRLAFSAPMGDSLAGYYRSSYEDRATGETRWVAVTQFEATDARRAFPCFDEPAFKATFTISLAHLDKYTAVSNMPRETSQPLEGRAGWLVDRFERSERMSTYLVAFLVSDFSHVDSYTADNSTLFRVWARREAMAQTRYASSVGPRVLSFYERFFQVPYPLPKQDMVAIPDFSAGAMENWGLITYRERLLLFHPELSSPQAKRDVASVIAHELAHQWFGNLVTMRWWSDLWLNEGFATYVATLGVQAVHPNWNSLEADALANLQAVFKLDALETSHPLSVPLKNPSEISQIFDAISYKKGSSLIRMMSHFLREAVFRGGLTNYLRQHRLDNAEQDDLWSALTAEGQRENSLPSEVTVKTIMDTWTLQTGYPLITVSRDYQTGTVNISQARYLSYDVSDPRRSESSNCWEVPVTYATASAPEEVRTVWLHCDQNEGSLSLETGAADKDWLLLNINSTGLFRVLYDERGWELLGEALQGDSDSRGLSQLSRAQLLEDALALAWSGDLPYGRAFSLLDYLHCERDYLPWKAALTQLSNLHRIVRRTAGYGLFRTFMLDLLEGSLQMWGDLRRPLPEDDLEGFRHRGLVVAWACRLGEPTCVEQANALFEEWMQQDNPNVTVPIPHGLWYEVTCTALQHGGARHWEFAWQRYLHTNVATERVELLKALTCAKEPWLLQRLLEWSARDDKGIRRQDSSTVFSSIASNEYGFHIAKDFFMKNIAQLYQFYGPKASRLSRYVKAVAEDMFHEQDLKEFDNFTERSAEYLKKASLAVKQARDKISVNVAWHRIHYAEFLRELQQMTKA